MSPYFSIVVPCYNRHEILPATVAAILQQQDGDFELLLVDDGSQDQTLAVAQELALCDARIRVFTQPNAERGAARNYGLHQARGRYVNYFDCDDKMYPHHLRVIREFLARNGEVELLHTEYDVITADGKVVGRPAYPLRVSTSEALLHDNFLACNTVFVRHDIALANPFVEDRCLASAEDWELWLRLASQYSFHYIAARTFGLCEHAGRSLNTIGAEAVRLRDERFIELVESNAAFVQRYGCRVAYFVANRYTFITLTFALTKRRRLDTLRYLLKALRADPTVLWRRRFLASLKHLI
ncbi:glycosyltransferase family 2 protein [Hymenobacter artigasi]|uniref:Glycosyltransferase involved in cell wall biosynthesis n=1 Tax=Hymenobacter artigasi TaxID=2719616 RepID=A0ABX1HQP5_9BACT|nr:glycosyltransferase family A protein [Hymenobacter artigasi]NKI91478.1 glycosyltransferase involved in cell wall biosynthesis [Hymenobacter artigasi]